MTGCCNMGGLLNHQRIRKIRTPPGAEFGSCEYNAAADASASLNEVTKNHEPISKTFCGHRLTIAVALSVSPCAGVGGDAGPRQWRLRRRAGRALDGEVPGDAEHAADDATRAGVDQRRQ